MSTQDEILSLMDLLDLDEEVIDTRLKSIMVRDTYTNKHLKNAIQLLQYKYLINIQEGTECENEEECSFIVKLINQLNNENAMNVCKIITIGLSLNSSSLVNKSEHFLQQMFSEICISSEKMGSEDSTLLNLKLCDSMLDAVIKLGEKLTLPFLEIPVSSILYSPDDRLRIHFITSTVPKLFEGVQGYNILDVIWNIIKEVNANKEMSLRILSSLSEYYIPVADKQEKCKLQSEVVYLLEFWNIILFGLCCNDSITRKISVYLGKRAIDCLTAGQRDINLTSENKIFSWDHKRTKELKHEWDNFFILVDSLEEKQSNIVLPSLHIFEKLKNIEICWLECPFNLGLQHDNTQVRYKCIMYKLNTSMKSLNEAIVLLEAFNDINIFDEVIGYEPLKTRMLDCFSNEKILNLILKALTSVKWSPVPLYHVTDVLSKLNVKGLLLENGTQHLCELLKIPCNNVLLRKAVQSNLFYFIQQYSKNLNWRDLLNIYPLFEVKLPSQKIISMFSQYLDDENEKTEFLKSLLELTSNHEKLELLLTFLDEQPHNASAVIELINEKIKRVQDIVSRQYSNRKDCFTDAVSIAIMYSKTKKKCTTNAVPLNKIVSQEKNLIMHYLLTLISSEVILDIEEMALISEILKEFDDYSLKESLFQLNKISLLLFTDKRSSLDKTVLGLFIIHSLMYNAIIQTHYKHEIINLKNLMELKTFESKQNSRLVNAFYEKLCESIFIYIKHDGNSDNNKYVLEFMKTVTECGGYGCLYWILKIMNIILPLILDNKDIKFDISQFIHRMWKEIEELKSNSQYGPCMEEFINLILQENFLNHPMYNNIITLYCNRIIESAIVRNTSLYYLVNKLKSTEINMNRGHLVYILCEILMFSPVPRKDVRIMDNLMIDILQNPKYKGFIGRPATHFNFQIQYVAISILSKIKHSEIYETITSYITNKIDCIFKNKQRYHGNSQSHRSLLTAVQHLLFIFLLQPSIRDLNRVKDWCLQLLAKLPHQPSVRLCLEWFIALFYYTKDTTINNVLISYLENAKVPITSQFIIIYYIMKRRIKTKCTEEEFKFVVTFFLGNTMGPMYNVRLYAQCLSKQLCLLKESPEHKYMMELVIKSCNKDKNCSKLENDFFISRFDIISELTPSFIYHFVPNYTEIVYDNIYTECINDELKMMSEAILNFKESSQNRQLSDEEVFEFDYPKNKANVVELTEGAGSIQKKYIPWRCMSDVNAYEILKKKESRSELIVVASLIDKLPNLGGMARTSEVFGVKTYVVDSLRHLQDRQFQALSVSAERWVNIEEVRPGAPLKQYLHSKKAEGYAVVAAEQTSTSCQLNSFKFPKKTVLLLGHEKEGVPCDLLPLMDHCVEVPQQGVVRSLNVHVTAAIFVWEYSRQHIL